MLSSPATPSSRLAPRGVAISMTSRGAVGDSTPLASLESELASTVELATTHGHVVGRRRLTPNLIEVTVGGFDGYPLRGGDEFVYAMVSHEPGGIPRGYDMTEFQAQEPDGPVRGAYYTVRRSRPDTGEIDLWVVVHHAPGSVADWMQRAAPGEPIALWGPRRGFVPVAGTRHVVLVADETGFAAVAALLESLDPDVAVTAVLETVDAQHRPDLPERAGATVAWVHRGPGSAGHVNRLLPATVELLGTGSDAAPDAAFGAAESRQISAVRRHLRTAIGVPATSMLMTGYWRRA